MGDANYRLQLIGIGKRFLGVEALRGVDFAIAPGTIVALVGENGAGKSTLAKIITGVHIPDAGEIRWEGETIHIGSVGRARDLGIAIVYQELGLVPQLTVRENLLLGREPTRLGPIGCIRGREELGLIAKPLAMVGGDIDPNVLIADLSIGERQRVEIAKALSMDARLLILDEPTSSLSVEDAERLFGIMRDLRGRGISIIFISHRLDEVLGIADRVVCLRDGEKTGDVAADTIGRDDLVRMMVGRDVTSYFVERELSAGEVALRVTNLQCSALRGAISFELRHGEILGFAGLVGSGRTELWRAIIGADPRTSGEIEIDGRHVDVRSPADAVAAGMVLVPEDRKQQGLLVDLTIRENIGLAGLRRNAHHGLVDGAKEMDDTLRYIRELDIKTPSPEQKARNLSGGNQQKVVLGKWLSVDPKVLVLDEPTRGVDVGAKAFIHARIADLAAQGMAIAMISSEMEEIIAMCDRVIVMSEGRAIGELGRGLITEENIMAMAAGRGVRA